MKLSRILIGLVVIFAAIAVGAVFQREWLTARYVAYRLVSAGEADAKSWIEYAAASGPAVEVRIWDMLSGDDATACARAQSILELRYAAERRNELLARLAGECERLNGPVQEWALSIAADSPTSDAASIRPLIEIGLKHGVAHARVLAIQLAARVEMTADPRIAAMIDDSDAEVRQAVVLALGMNRASLSDDDLLPRLHDEDRTVQRMARTALLSRGLTERQIKMGKLLADPQPASRLQLVSMLRDEGDLDLSQWLRRLSRDASPAVRTAAIRTAAELHVFQMADRIAEMVSTDPDAAVRPIALFHLRQFNVTLPVGFETQNQ